MSTYNEEDHLPVSDLSPNIAKRSNNSLETQDPKEGSISKLGNTSSLSMALARGSQKSFNINAHRIMGTFYMKLYSL